MMTTTTTTGLRPLAILSLLADPVSPGAATRRFRGRPVLAHTIDRVHAAASCPELVVLAWNDQMPVLKQALGEDLAVHAVGPRRSSTLMNLASASLRWADGWRGGLLGVSTFDRGFDAGIVLQALDQRECDAALLVDPHAALLDPSAIDSIVTHLAARPLLEYAFLPGAPGTGAMMLRVAILRELHRAARLPGQLLAYHPDRPVHDPLAKEPAVQVSARTARSLDRLTFDSSRQLRRLSLTQAGEATDAVLERLQSDAALDAMPREIVIELNTDRATAPVYSILGTTRLARERMGVDRAKRIFAQLGGVDDVRLTLAGVGDPLLHPQFDEILLAARQAGITAIHVETDLLTDRREYLDLLAADGVDVVSVHLPAVHRDTYREIMGVDRVQDVLGQMKQLVTARSRGNTGLPIVAPLFVKCERNLGEMEEWYDQWIRAVGAAVIRGPSDFGGAIPYVGVSDMLPAVRAGCSRLSSRMTVLSDGTIVSCEEDVLARQPAGHVDRDSIASAWQAGMRPVRNAQCEMPVCRKCRVWGRP